MATAACLQDQFVATVEQHSQRTAVVEPGVASITYAELAALSGRVRDYLAGLGLGPGDRVGVCVRKSIDTVAALHGILQAGCGYVPVDSGAPAARCAFILHDCAVKLVIVEARLQDRLASEMAALGTQPVMLVLDQPGGGQALGAALDAAGDARPTAIVSCTPDDLAYVLYTSGSTGKPKGVTLTHGNAVSFVDWCSEIFRPSENDRFSSHAPFHFDLSILDLYVPCKHGAALVLISEEAGKEPVQLARLIAGEQISVWYSAPSILSLLAQFGHLEQGSYPALRLVLFAGEVFPVKHLRELCRQLPGPRYFNLYGPTETNVCTYYEIPTPVPETRNTPYPIGKVCSHLRGRVVDEQGCDVAAGNEGELCIAGLGVMQGYWNLPEQSARAFLPGNLESAWYRTGDIVVEADDGNYVYRGRRDRMVKRRGYRVELGEIESGLYRHAQIKEAAVIAIQDEEAGVRIIAYLSAHEGKRPSLIELKRFCSEQLPLYMIPDTFSWQQALPKTSTDKIDYQRLRQMAA